MELVIQQRVLQHRDDGKRLPHLTKLLVKNCHAEGKELFLEDPFGTVMKAELIVVMFQEKRSTVCSVFFMIK